MRLGLTWTSAALILLGCTDPMVDPAAPPADMAPAPDLIPAPDLTPPLPTAGDGHVAAAVIDTLQALYSTQRERTWSVTTGNALEAGWLLQSPPPEHFGKGYSALTLPGACSAGCAADFGLRNCATQADCVAGGRCADVAATVTAPGKAPRKMCVGHSDFLYEEMYRAVASAERYADVTSLLPPDGRIEAALRNAITYLGQSGKAVQVRLLFGCYPFTGGTVDAKAVLARLTRDLPSGAKVQVYVGNYRSSNAPPSWNHSKIIAVDGRVAIVGGHNLWDAHYLGVDPVHDVSMRLQGPAARHAHQFVNEQWRYTCANRSALYCSTGSLCSYRWGAGAVDDGCAPQIDTSALAAPAPGDVRVLGVGRLALIDSSNQSNPSDAAMLAMIGAARTSIRISQQDFGPPLVPILGIPAGKWPEALLAALGAAVLRGVDVYLVVSNQGSVAGGLPAAEASYSNSWTAADLAQQLRDALVKNLPLGAPSGAALREILCQRLHVAPLRFGDEDQFPSGVPFPNHAKLMMVDDQAFYVGSQNLYDAGLTEYGFVVDDQRAAALLRSSYYDLLWRHSSRKAVSGSEAAVCSLTM